MNWLALVEKHLASSRRISAKRFRLLFGVDPWALEYIYYVYLSGTDFKPYHLLYLYAWMKNYFLDEVAHHFFKCTNARSFNKVVMELLTYLGDRMDEVCSSPHPLY
jgi:hypothetical protein